MIPVTHALPAWWYSNGFGVRLIIVYILMALDILANNAIEPPDGEVMAFYAITANKSIQLALHLANGIVFFTLFQQTFLYQARLYSLLVVRFKAFFGVGILNFGFLVGLRIYRIMVVSQSLTNRTAIWDKPGYLPFYIIQRLVSIVNYYIILQTCGQLSDEALYRISPNTLHQLIAKHGM